MQRDRLYRLLQRSRDAAFALTANGDVWAWNAAAEALTGFAAEHVLQHRLTDRLETRGPLGRALDAEYCARAIRDGGVPTFDVELRTARGEWIWVNVTVLVFEALRSSPPVVVHLAHDITASRRQRALWERLIGTAREIVALADTEHHLIPVSPLTDHEQRILRLFAEGRSAAEVARTTGISAQTLRNHLHHINQKLGTHDRLAAVIHAVRRRLI